MRGERRYCFTAPAVSPWISQRCITAKRSTGGRPTSSAAAIRLPYCGPYWLTKLYSATVASGVCPPRMKANRNSFHAVMKAKVAVAASAGAASGSTTCRSACSRVLPSSIDASSSSAGIVSK